MRPHDRKSPDAVRYVILHVNSILCFSLILSASCAFPRRLFRQALLEPFKLRVHVGPGEISCEETGKAFFKKLLPGLIFTAGQNGIKSAPEDRRHPSRKAHRPPSGSFPAGSDRPSPGQSVLACCPALTRQERHVLDQAVFGPFPFQGVARRRRDHHEVGLAAHAFQ